ncbi:class I SAM-dependent methyltransferase [Hyphococcus sp.]|uniref:class I SAM-dependent methyltransferase n=1 Tax=Hyphococcus sp. TaxID=2038636 RepID=UPI00208BB337|nr:MAG: hypothetical protein DHS20C04_20130 [Marinicaulis sp.]
MLSCDVLRKKIQDANAQEAIVKALKLDMDPARFLEEAPDQIVVDAFAKGSLNSPQLCAKLHNRPIPEAGTQNVLEKNLGYELNRAFWHAQAYTKFGEKYGRPFENAKAVMDFGCGTSRLLRYLVDYMPGPQYYGSEVNAENIEWGRTNYPEVKYLHHSPKPPITCEAGVMDVIYGQSIFSHYAESLHELWLKELHRLLAPGGLLMVTKEGGHLVRRCKTEPDTFKALGLDKQDADAIWRRFDETGYSFYTRYRKDRLAERGIDSDLWGTAFVSNDYVHKNWSSLFEVLEIQDGAVGNRQDYVILRKKG